MTVYCEPVTAHRDFAAVPRSCGCARGAGRAGPARCSRSRTRVHGQVELLARVLREGRAGLLLHDLLVRLDQLARGPRRSGRRPGVDAALVASLVHRVGELLSVDAQHGLAEHLDQPAVGVPGEPLVAGELGQPAAPTRRSGRCSGRSPSSRASRTSRRSAPRPAAGPPGRRACARPCPPGPATPA